MNFDFGYFLKRFTVISKYIPVTLGIAIGAMIIGLILGFGIALMRESRNKLVRGMLEVYVSFFRGTPLMVQLFLFYFGLPQLIPSLSKVGALYMAVAVMSVNASAYLSETIRAAIGAVDKSQMEAAYAIGMTPWQGMKRIVLPQALRIAIPPLSNTFISLIQGTAITFVIGVKDIMASAKVGAAASFKLFENYLAVGLIYWMIVIIITQLTKLYERKTAVGRSR